MIVWAFDREYHRKISQRFDSPLLSVSGRALNPAVQIDHPKNNHSDDCLPVPARRARQLIGRSAGKLLPICEPLQNFRQQHADYGQIITDNYFPGGHWTAGFIALPETSCGRGQPLSFTLSFGEIPWFDEEGEIRRCDWLKRNP